MKYYITFVLTILSLVATAQQQDDQKKQQQELKLSDKLKSDFERVHWDLVESVVSDPTSEFYYPSMYARYMAADTTLTLIDYRMLYYGYSYQEIFDPLAEKLQNDLVMKYQTEIATSYTQEDLHTMIEMAKKAIANDPFNLRMLNILIYTYTLLKDEYNIIVNTRRMNGVIEAILSSGSGVHKDSPWSVIYREDIVDLVTVLGGVLKLRMYITTTVEYFHLDEKIEDVRGFYFDLSAILRRAKLTERGFKGFEFNPLYNPKSKSYINRKIGK